MVVGSSYKILDLQKKWIPIGKLVAKKNKFKFIFERNPLALSKFVPNKTWNNSEIFQLDKEICDLSVQNIYSTENADLLFSLMHKN